MARTEAPGQGSSTMCSPLCVPRSHHTHKVRQRSSHAYRLFLAAVCVQMAEGKVGSYGMTQEAFVSSSGEEKGPRDGSRMMMRRSHILDIS